jgi:hypothetical protein
MVQRGKGAGKVQQGPREGATRCNKGRGKVQQGATRVEGRCNKVQQGPREGATRCNKGRGKVQQGATRAEGRCSRWHQGEGSECWRVRVPRCWRARACFVRVAWYACSVRCARCAAEGPLCGRGVTRGPAVCALCAWYRCTRANAVRRGRRVRAGRRRGTGRSVATENTGGGRRRLQAGLAVKRCRVDRACPPPHPGGARGAARTGVVYHGVIARYDTLML